MLTCMYIISGLIVLYKRFELRSCKSSGHHFSKGGKETT